MTCTGCLGTGEAVDPKIKQELLELLEHMKLGSVAVEAGRLDSSVLMALHFHARSQMKGLKGLDRLRYIAALNEINHSINYSSAESGGGMFVEVAMLRRFLQESQQDQGPDTEGTLFRSIR